jgi:DnaK suppressor protein
MTKTELERVTRHRDGTAIERSSEHLEEIQGASQRAIAICNLDRGSNRLRNARAALRRIEEDKFGICQECDQDINLKRLAAVPWAPFCIRCQEAIDSNLDGTQSSIGDLLGRAA